SDEWRVASGETAGQNRSGEAAFPPPERETEPAGSQRYQIGEEGGPFASRLVFRNRHCAVEIPQCTHRTFRHRSCPPRSLNLRDSAMMNVEFVALPSISRFS